MHQEVVLAMLAKEPSHGYGLRTRLAGALEPLGQELNEGQIYVTLSRLEKAGLVRAEAGGTERPGRKVYVLTPRGEDRVAEWLAEVSWPRPDLAEFHLKLLTAAAARLADPIGIIDDQRRELLRRLRDAQRAAREEAPRLRRRSPARGGGAPSSGRPALARGLRNRLDRAARECRNDPVQEPEPARPPPQL